MVVSLVADISVGKSETFRSRLKQWQKMGFPEGTKVGKGVKAEYGALQIFQLILLIKLLSIGLTPERAQNLIKFGWPRFKFGFIEALKSMKNSENRLHYFFIQIDALSELTAPGKSDDTHTFVDVFADYELLMALDAPDPNWTDQEKRQQSYLSFLVKNRMLTTITVEIDSLFVWVWAALGAVNKSPDIFADELAEWAAEIKNEGDEFSPSQKHFDNHPRNQSIALRTDNMDCQQLALQSLSKVI